MNLAPVVARLRAQTGTTFRNIGSAAELQAAIATGTPAAPSAYVIPLEESGGEPYLVSGTAQRVTQVFGVLLVLRSARDGAKGGGVIDDLDTLRSAVQAALHGWQIGDAYEPCTFQRGELSSFEAGAMSWLDTWKTATEMRTLQ
jgi:hypothetical protein